MDTVFNQPAIPVPYPVSGSSTAGQNRFEQNAQTWQEEWDPGKAASAEEELERRRGNAATPEMREMLGEGQSKTGWCW